MKFLVEPACPKFGEFGNGSVTECETLTIVKENSKWQQNFQNLAKP